MTVRNKRYVYQPFAVTSAIRVFKKADGSLDESKGNYVEKLYRSGEEGAPSATTTCHNSALVAPVSFYMKSRGMTLTTRSTIP